MMHRLALALLLVACTKPAPTTTSADAATPPPIVDAAVEAMAKLSPDDDARRVVRAWSDALDRHDVEALRPLYADKVVYYTAQRTKAQVLGWKKNALGPTSTFHQQITSDIDITDGDGGTKIAMFTKRSGNGTKLGKTKAELILGGSPLVINAELDAPKRADDCEAAVMSAFNALPAVQKAMDDVRKELPKYPDRTEGGVGPMHEDDGTISGMLGVFQPERFETIAGFSYAPSGVLEVTVMGDSFTSNAAAASDKAHLIAPSTMAKIKTACGH